MADKGDTNWFSNPDPEDLRPQKTERHGPPEIVVGGRTYDLLHHSGNTLALSDIIPPQVKKLYAVEPPYYKIIKELAGKIKTADNPKSPFNFDNDLSSKSYQLAGTYISARTPGKQEDPYASIVICSRNTTGTGEPDQFVQALEDRQSSVYTAIKAFVNESVPPLISAIEDERNSNNFNLGQEYKLGFTAPYLSAEKNKSIKLIHDLFSPGWKVKNISQDKNESLPMTIILE